MDIESSSPPDSKLPRLDNYFWALALIIAGLVFGTDSLDILPEIGSASTWSWVFLGAGVVGLGLNFYATTAAGYQAPSTWDWIFSAFLFAIGLGGFLGVDIAFPIILIALGVAALLGMFTRKE
jgi:hypothetical protein